MRLIKGMTVEQISGAIQSHLQDAQYDHLEGFSVKQPVAPIKVGTTEQVSIQASKMHYSTPRENEAFYTGVEMGFPTFMFSDEFIAKYAEEPIEPTQTVYLYVPIEELAQQIYQYLQA